MNFKNRIPIGIKFRGFTLEAHAPDSVFKDEQDGKHDDGRFSLSLGQARGCLSLSLSMAFVVRSLLRIIGLVGSPQLNPEFACVL